jgi:uncharacterized repeat protein (TIGR03806 family)
MLLSHPAAARVARRRLDFKDRVTQARAWVGALALLLISGAQGAPAEAQFGLEKRVVPRAYLRMPDSATGKVPQRLSQTGVYRDVRTLTVNRGLIPYELILPFWSDGAQKGRWMAVPRGRIGFAPSGEWTFPAGTVFVKTFDLPTDARNPAVTRRLETRLLVRDKNGGVYGVVYKWRPDGSDADLIPAQGASEDIPVRGADGAVHQQNWYYPSRQDCLKCHNSLAGGVLGVKTRQMNRDLTYPGGVTDNELRALNHIGLFEPRIDEAQIPQLQKLATPTDASRTIEDRARSYLDANCSQCHRPGGTVAGFDARYDSPLEKQELVDGPVLINEGIDRARIISPHDIWRSIAYMRVNTVGDIRMPPVARQQIDPAGVALLRDWITSLPGKDVLDPPAIAPGGGSFTGPVKVTLSAREPGAQIHYTLDGSIPGSSDPVYKEPIPITSTTIVRARAYKEGFTRSIPAQQLFTVAPP